MMPKKNRLMIYEHLFKEGVMVAEKDFNAPKHPELESVPNLQVSHSRDEVVVILTYDSVFRSSKP